ncbi:DNA phosphorothioation-associated DGQHR protein 1 [Bisbaumannia pacifica]|uniref:DGQHR domain-containing protein n=1 Tax=Bisbaumannia pacifica TaxID=77098 RepID=A0ABD4L4D4_9GAMM|nr:DNA phosphorothioation-associated DGQHR protein 1 [Halomonas pacifica]MBH8581093.1 DGQHR domain-containing protein [Halomonas pacifica]
MKKSIFPLKVRAIKVEQDLSTFYAVSLSAKTLLEVAYSDVMKAEVDFESGGYQLSGTQRQVQEKRLREISRYINRDDAAFPNSIILAANINESDGFFSSFINDSEEVSWRIEEDAHGFLLIIPSPEKVASIIDGQHRLFGFVGAEKNKLEMELLCSVYLDLPKPYQAQLFATINSNQKKVDKSLTYELFGYNIHDEPPESWSPDKLAVFLTRKLNVEKDSPFHKKIKLAPRDAKELLLNDESCTWMISTSAVVEGVLRLISSNPRVDSNIMSTPIGKERRSVSERSDKSPFRELYIDGSDILIYSAVKNFFLACEKIFWKKPEATYMTKTVGVQALFDVLREISSYCVREKKLSEQFFLDVLSSAGNVSLSDEEFRQASGAGRVKIKREILKSIDDKYLIDK